MLTRRQLLSRGTTLFMLVPIVPALLQACSSGGGGGTGDPTAPTCAGTYTESSNDDDHTHAVCIPNADMDSPPTGGATYVSTNNGNHTHQVTLTAAQLATLGSGGTVPVMSTSDIDPLDNSNHTHMFNLKKAASTTPQPPPTDTGW
jgi:hypothetical protein